VTIRPFAREKKRFAQKFTDGQTGGQTTDAARLYKLMNELKTWDQRTDRDRRKTEVIINEYGIVHCISEKTPTNITYKSKELSK